MWENKTPNVAHPAVFAQVQKVGTSWKNSAVPASKKKNIAAKINNTAKIFLIILPALPGVRKEIGLL
jgi:hypothetical protein